MQDYGIASNAYEEGNAIVSDPYLPNKIYMLSDMIGGTVARKSLSRNNDMYNIHARIKVDENRRCEQRSVTNITCVLPSCYLAGLFQHHA